MSFLHFLEGLRNPVFDAFFSLVTRLGEETFFIVMGMVFFWCINKRLGYYLLSVGLTGTVLNQFLKLTFRIPRPWVRDNTLTVVGDATEAATGYSFPSGHTQTALGIYGGIARWYKSKWVRIVCITVCVLVAFSRMYLGVHTPADVLVSSLLAVVLVFGFYPIAAKATDNPKGMRILFAAMTLFALSYMLFVNLYKFPAHTDAENLAHGIKNSYTMLGCILSIWLSFELDTRYIKFETKAVWWVQLIKLALGFGLVMAIKAGLKQPLYAVLGEGYFADGVRYFLMTAFAGCVWPITFKYFNKLSKKRD